MEDIEILRQIAINMHYKWMSIVAASDIELPVEDASTLQGYIDAIHKIGKDGKY